MSVRCHLAISVGHCAVGMAAAVALVCSAPLAAATSEGGTEATARATVVLSADGPPMADVPTPAFTAPATDETVPSVTPAAIAKPPPDAAQIAFQAQFSAAVAERDQLRADAERVRSQRNFFALLLVAGIAGGGIVRWLASATGRAAATSAASAGTGFAARRPGTRVFVADPHAAVGDPSGGFVVSGRMTAREPDGGYAPVGQTTSRESSGRIATQPRVTLAAGSGGGQRNG